MKVHLSISLGLYIKILKNQIHSINLKIYAILQP